MGDYYRLPDTGPSTDDVEVQQRQYQQFLEGRERAYGQPGLQLAAKIQEPPKRKFPIVEPSMLEREVIRTTPKQAIH